MIRVIKRTETGVNVNLFSVELVVLRPYGSHSLCLTWYKTSYYLCGFGARISETRLYNPLYEKSMHYHVGVFREVEEYYLNRCLWS